MRVDQKNSSQKESFLPSLWYLGLALVLMLNRIMKGKKRRSGVIKKKKRGNNRPKHLGYPLTIRFLIFPGLSLGFSFSYSYVQGPRLSDISVVKFSVITLSKRVHDFYVL